MSDHDHHSQGHAGHSHGLVRADEIVGVSDARLLWAVGLNQMLTIGQVIAGVFSGSIALLSDAAHNFNDANALLIAYIARRISKEAASERYTFGYRRAEMIGALINLTLLSVIGLYLVYEGISRLFQPEEIVGWLMAAMAVIALFVDVGTALLLWTMRGGSLNVRAAFIHNIVDALGSVAVLIGATAIIWFEWLWVDAVVTLLIAGYVLGQVVKMFPQATRMLMEGAPLGMDLDALTADVGRIDGVEGLHHLHVWELDEQHRALEAHVVIMKRRIGDLEFIKRQIKAYLLECHSIGHSTLEFEVEGSKDCDDSGTIVAH
jgi:cobalt-zinc-cadmium efflux system protein